MENYFAAAAVLVIQTVFGLFMLAVLLRFILQLVRADFYNPLSQAVVKVTNPVLKPLRRVIPGLGGIDVASVVLLIALQVVQLILIGLATSRLPGGMGLILLTVTELLALILNFYMVTIILQAILSWFGPSGRNPLIGLLHSVNEPLLTPARRIIPSLSGIDLSPLVVVLLLQLSKILILAPLLDWAARG